MSLVRLLPVFTALLVVSCATHLAPEDQAIVELRGNTLKDASALMKRAKKMDTDTEISAVYQLRAAEIAWSQLDTNGGSISDVKNLGEPQKQALRIIAKATEGVAPHFVAENYQPEKTFSYAGISYRVSAGIDYKAGVYPLARLEFIKPAREVKHELCTNWHLEDGVGVPCAPKWKRPTDPKMQRFVTTRGYLQPITALMNFNSPAKAGEPRKLSITGYDPTYLSRVKLGATDYPLAADFTAPIVAQTNDIHEFKIALTGLIKPGGIDSRLILMEPYDKDRIPVLLVHGLNSHPRMWRNVINDLRADPKLRGRYQFMLFYYPTGWPISYSSMRLREELAAFHSLVGTPKKMVVIGHSMGGLLSRMQVIDPEREIWNKQLGENAQETDARLKSNSLPKRMLLFSANPRIGRQIYICTPHRGSGLADLSLTSWFIKLVSLPATITGALIDLPTNLIDHGKLTSVGGLSPSNPLYKALDEIPILVPHHSIMGDRGHGDGASSSDGVVPYWSSHLKSADSEVIVPDNHGAFNHPQAIDEMRRILLLNAGMKN